MEIVAVIFLLWLIGGAFPSSGHSYGPDIGEVAGFLACAAFLVGLFFAWGYSMAGIMIGLTWLGVHEGIAIPTAMLGPIILFLTVPQVIWGANEHDRVT